MKKYLVLIAFLGLGLTTFTGCGNNSNKSVIGADGKEYDSYQSACRHQDFVAAYDWIEKNNGSDDDKDYVFNAEMLYLTSLGTEEASNRIVYLLAEYQIPGVVVNNSTPNVYDNVKYGDGNLYNGLKTYIDGIKRFNKRCDNVLDIAITQNNKKLCQKIISLYKADINVGKDDPDRGDLFFSRPILDYTSKEAAQAKLTEAFGKEEAEEPDEEKAPSTPKDTKKKRRR